MTNDERRRKRRRARSSERMRLSSSDTAMECERREVREDSNKAGRRKRKSMSDYMGKNPFCTVQVYTVQSMSVSDYLDWDSDILSLMG